jgi:hypothetical protein
MVYWGFYHAGIVPQVPPASRSLASGAESGRDYGNKVEIVAGNRAA